MQTMSPKQIAEELGYPWKETTHGAQNGAIEIRQCVPTGDGFLATFAVEGCELEGEGYTLRDTLKALKREAENMVDTLADAFNL